jgi:glycosyltransferase involved in cell wall biosynthesis
MPDRPETSVLMPTYNDSKYVTTAIHSILKQRHKKWELIVIDGSTDDTPNIIREFTDDRIVYLREKSSGQLNALMTGVPSIRGKYITILHSDDELSDDKALERNVSALKNQDCDGVFSDIVKMDEIGTVSGRIRTVKSITASSPAMLFLRGGSNIIPDFFFVKKEAFGNVLSNYITWNMPYWLRFDGSRIGTLSLKMVEPWYRYRVYSENYIRSDVGKFETINGCLRTVIEVGQRLDLPFPRIQRLLAKASKMRLKSLFRRKPCSPEHLQETIQYVFRRYFSEIPENPYFRGLLGFYESYPSQRTISLKFKEDDKIFLGKDARIFFNLMQKKSLPSIYEHILEEATNGFGKVVVTSNQDYEKARNIMRFLNLFTQVEVA